jgi:signal transduction histidine kinase
MSDIIRRNVDRLKRLVQDLTELDRAAVGSMDVEWAPVDLAELAESAVAAQRPVATAKNVAIVLDVEHGEVMEGDSHRLGQLLDILISNAVKFTPEGGRVEVRATPLRVGWHLEVVDDGIGVPVNEQGRLFDRFYRASNATLARIPGSGLGLSVARAIAEVHGGAIALRSAQGVGTTVSVTLPYVRPSESPPHELDEFHDDFHKWFEEEGS